MKAVIYRRYGSPDVVEIVDAEKPAPADDEVLMRIRAASVNAFDWGLVRATPAITRLMMGIRKPKQPRLGRDVAGHVEAAGRNVTRFKPGDEVFGVCAGAFAEYACTTERRLAIKPPNVAFEQAAAVPIAGSTALQGLRDKGRLQPGHRVLVNGATGGVGTFAVQIAKALGAEVTGVCSTRNLELVRSIGADRVIDYAREDFTRGGQQYDLIFDVIGNHSFSACRRVMSPNAIYVPAGGGGPDGHRLFRWLAVLAAERQWARFTSQKMSFFMARIVAEDLTTIAEMIASGKIAPVIDRRYKLSEAREAIRYFAEGHARGKIIVSIT